MSISGLVLTLSNDSRAEAAMSTLASDPRLTVGERFDRRVAVVATTPSVESDRELWDDLRSIPGIAFVDVTFVHLDEENAAEENCGHNQRVEDQHAHS